MKERSFHVQTESQRAMLSQFVLRQPIPFQATLGPFRERRSNSANSRLWLLHTAASKVTGYEPEELHELMLCKHFGFTEVERPDLLTGELTMMRVPLKRSSTRDKKEFAEFMEACEIFYGQEFGVWLSEMEAE
ncbi:MAG: hypothetical protein FJX76_01540 [Armatimonadetes bacterium]|nr:hypothetical protein [Armatimonadota bacterium]MBM3738927.1 hypothetical protein [Acidobacteriota bacterium]